MRFMIMVKATADSEAGVMPTEAEFTAMGKFNEELVQAGVMEALGAPEGLRGLGGGDARVGEWRGQDIRIPLVSATGSTRMGKAVATAVAGRLGRSLLELGGNNAIIVAPDADLKLVTLGAVFWPVRYSDQRCRPHRRLHLPEFVFIDMPQHLVA